MSSYVRPIESNGCRSHSIHPFHAIFRRPTWCEKFLHAAYCHCTAGIRRLGTGIRWACCNAVQWLCPCRRNGNVGLAKRIIFFKLIQEIITWCVYYEKRCLTFSLALYSKISLHCRESPPCRVQAALRLTSIAHVVSHSDKLERRLQWNFDYLDQNSARSS